MKIKSSGIYPQLLQSAKLAYAPGIGGPWLQTAVLPNGINEILMVDFHFEWKGQKYTIPRGFVTDGASVPWFFQRLLPRQGRYFAAAVIHDYLYWSGLLSRKEADLVLLEFSKRLRVGWIDRHMLYRGVRIGGWVAWGQYRKQEKKEERAA
jgi:hypothetical protein